MIKTGQIFHAIYNNYYGDNKKHFFYCIYTQEQDNHNSLNEDIIGLMITTNKKYDKIIKSKNDYNVKIKINGKVSYVCCDKIFRFNLKDQISNKGDLLNKKDKKQILKNYKKFLNESLKQLGDKNGI